MLHVSTHDIDIDNALLKENSPESSLCFSAPLPLRIAVENGGRRLRKEKRLGRWGRMGWEHPLEGTSSSLCLGPVRLAYLEKLGGEILE